MLAVFSCLGTKMLFNKSEVIALQVRFACKFGLIDVTLSLGSIASGTSTAV